MHHAQQSSNPAQSPSSRRSDAGKIRIQPRDAAGLLTLAEMYASPYDLLADRLAVSDHRMRGIAARWRDAGLASTGKLSAGPPWCWLTPAGMRQAGHDWEAAPPPLARLAHIRAVLAARNWLEGDAAWKAGQAQWRSERHLRGDRPGVGQPGHVPDAEILWPSVPGSPRPGQAWAIEAELTPKAAARAQRIMSGLLAQHYDHVLYLCAPAALPVITAAAAKLTPDRAARLFIRELPPAALMPRAA